MDFDAMCKALVERRNFSFSRWGDGEWLCVIQPEGRNCDGHEYFIDLSHALALVLRSKPEYVMGMQPKAVKDLGNRIQSWLDKEGLHFDWVDSDVIHYASSEGRLDEMGNALFGRKVVLVGNKALIPIAKKMGADFVEIPKINAWKWYRKIYTDICDKIDKDVVVLYCAGMLTEVAIHHVWNDCGDVITQIDMGSVLDPYVGVKSRNYHQQIIDRLA